MFSNTKYTLFCTFISWYWVITNYLRLLRLSSFDYRDMYQRRTESTTLDHWCLQEETLKICSKSMRDKSNKLFVKHDLTRPEPIKTTMVTIKEMFHDSQNLKLLFLGRNGFSMTWLFWPVNLSCMPAGSFFRDHHILNRDNMPLRFKPRIRWL